VIRPVIQRCEQRLSAKWNGHLIVIESFVTRRVTPRPLSSTSNSAPNSSGLPERYHVRGVERTSWQHVRERRSNETQDRPSRARTLGATRSLRIRGSCAATLVYLRGASAGARAASYTVCLHWRCRIFALTVKERLAGAPAVRQLVAASWLTLSRQVQMTLRPRRAAGA